MTAPEEGCATVTAVPKKKSAEDHEIENRVRGWIRSEMVERGISVNRANAKIGLAHGTLSRILNEERGFGAGFVLKVQRAFNIPSKLLLEENPPLKYMQTGIPHVEEPK